MIKIKYAQHSDQDFWFRLDTHLSKEVFVKKVKENECYIIFMDDNPIGLLRYHLFWDNTPFCSLLFIDEKYQRQGYGRKLMEHWEKDMKAKGYGMVLTSTQVDEEAQHFYRKLGYKDCGGFVIDLKGFEQPMEMIMVKGI